MIRADDPRWRNLVYEATAATGGSYHDDARIDEEVSQQRGQRGREEDIALIERLRYLEAQGLMVLTEGFKNRLHLLGTRRFEATADGKRVLFPDRWLTSHLFDSLEIDEKALSTFKACGIIHDIGKTGPEHATTETQELIVNMFATDHDLFEVAKKANGSDDDVAVKSLLERTIRANTKYTDEQNIRAEIAHAQKLLQEIGIDSDTPLRAFYMKHVEWGAEILAGAQGIPSSIKYPAMNHHSVLHGTEFMIPGYTATSEDKKNALWLEVVDYYQAATRRNPKSKPEVIWKDIQDKFIPRLSDDRILDFEFILNYIKKNPLPPDVMKSPV